MSKYRITVFTPTFNRSNKIKSLFNSLCKQDFSDFQWLIVDNGDEKIEDLIAILKKKAKFDIVYVKSNIPGINRAFNKAINLAKGTLFFKVDDDDYLTTDALSFLDQSEKSISKRKDFAGIAGLRSYHNGEIIGGHVKFTSEYVDANNFEREKLGLGGDKAECYYTKILKQFLPFPEFKGETYTDESILYNRIADHGYKLRWYNKVIYYTEYLPDGTTKNLLSKLKSNPQTYTYLVNQRLKFSEISMLAKIKLLCRYIEVSRQTGNNLEKIKESINYSSNFVNVCWILSYITVLIPRKTIQ